MHQSIFFFSEVKFAFSYDHLSCAGPEPYSFVIFEGGVGPEPLAFYLKGVTASICLPISCLFRENNVHECLSFFWVLCGP